MKARLLILFICVALFTHCDDNGDELLLIKGSYIGTASFVWKFGQSAYIAPVFIEVENTGLPTNPAKNHLMLMPENSCRLVGNQIWFKDYRLRMEGWKITGAYNIRISDGTIILTCKTSEVEVELVMARTLNSFPVLE